LSRDAWTYWYLRKEHAVDECMPKLERAFRDNQVSRMLDLGCGTGRHTIYFAERGFDVYGFDLSPHAIQRATERLKNRKLIAHLTVWDMSKRFPYESEFFDAVIAIRVIHHASTKVIKHVVSEVSRITRKEGYFYVQAPTLERNIRHQKSGPKIKLIEPGTHVPLEGPEKGVPHHGFTRLELLELLGSFSFETLDVYERDEHFNLLAVKRR